MAGGLGVEISLKNLPGKFTNDHAALFSESQGRILVTVSPNNAEGFGKIMRGNTFKRIGYVTDKNNLVVKGLVDIELARAEKSYKSTLKDY